MTTLTNNLQTNVNLVKQPFNQSESIQSLSIQIGSEIEGILLYLEETVDEKKIHSFLLEPLQLLLNEKLSFEQLSEVIRDGSPFSTQSVQSCVDQLLNGRVVLLFSNPSAYVINCSNWQVRVVDQPLSSGVYEGPASGLTEDISINLNLIRNYYRSSNLTIERFSVGGDAKKEMAVISVHGTADTKLVNEVIHRLKSVKANQFIINQLTKDSLEGKGFLFPRTMSIDRPDACAMALSQGRIIILVEGSPLAVIAPSILYHFFQNQDDYLSDFGRFGARPLRYAYFVISTFIPAITVAIVRFHLDDIPNSLYVQLEKTHDTLAPFTIELLFVILLMQLIMDGSYKLPGNAIFAVTFIGTMLISDVATEVNLFHPVTIVIIGICYITSFPVLHRSLLSPIFFTRILLILLAQFLGFIGIFIGSAILFINAARLDSVGVPYLYPFLPFQPERWKDTVFRPGLLKVMNRPNVLPFNKKRALAGRKTNI
ncbi:spore germination protein GerAA, germination response to L-alanine and related amino acids [Bacillus sp. JCM 19046]|nr:spore germination protein GerAA, germination response to L-alanine and related amino acids [Bacillus sp. JCM 19046]